MEFLKLLTWFCTNVCVPLLAPIALLPLLGLRKRFKGRTKKIVMRALQEGQLCWTVIAMCVAACYEASGEVHSFAGYPTVNIVIGRVTTIWHGCMIVVASIVVMLGAEDAEDELIDRRTEPVSLDTVTPPSPIMLSSVYLAVITATSFTLTHLWVG